MPARAIETQYAGCLFRSRAEARWAAFFDALSIEWQYEPEGFDLSPNRRYLPDFEVPGVLAPDGRRGVYVEVKGDQPTEAESRRCQDLAAQTGKAVVLAIRAPLPPSVLDGTENDSLHYFKPGCAGPADVRYGFWECSRCRAVGVAYGGFGMPHGDEDSLCGTDTAKDAGIVAGPSTPRLLAAYVAARAHRFGT